MASLLRLIGLKPRWTWWLMIVMLLSVCGQEIERSIGFGVAAAELEGFGDELEDEDEEEQIVVPPPVRSPGFQTDRGPPDDVDDAKARQELERDAASKGPAVDDWDEDEFEGVEHLQKPAQKPKPKSQPNFFQANSAPQSTGPKKYYFEMGALSVLLVYLVIFLIGRSENTAVAQAWVEQFGTKETILGKNFSLLGVGGDNPGEEVQLLGEGYSVFKFYASGRRYCDGLLATLNMRSRQDLFSRLWNYLQPSNDELNVEVFMNEDCMDPMVLAVARKRAGKALAKNSKDILAYANTLELSSRRNLAEELVVIGESRELATDLLSDTIIEQVFGDKAFEKHGQYFQSMVFSDQTPDSSHKKTLKFNFVIPPVAKMAELSRLMSIIPYFIDAIGRHKLSTQARAKAEERRSKAREEEERELLARRQEALARKKQQKKEEEEALAATLSKEAQARLEAKNRKKELKKNVPKMKMAFAR